ncbi:MAG: hypothetical protein J4G12_03265 [Gemmatimonadetes bacterium]|nr:hypothetical protein [Gemmatimonadota bacterium]
MIPRYKYPILLSLMLVASACASGGGGSAVIGGSAGGERPRQTENTRTAQRLLDQAEDAQDQGAAQDYYQQAFEAAGLAIAEDGRNPLGHRQAALAAVGLRDFEMAGMHFDHAGELWPVYGLEDQGLREQLWIQLYNEAAPLLSSGDYEQAASVFEDAHAIYKQRPEVMVRLAQIYGQISEADRSIELIAEAQAFTVTEDYMNADSTMQAGWDELIADLPVLRAQVLATAGRNEEAVEAYQALIAEDPGNKTVILNLAGLLIEIDNDAEAFRLYDELMASDTELESLDFYRMGVGYYNGDDNAGAIEAFGRTVEMNPFDRDALEMLSRTLATDSLYEQVIPAVERWLELDPESAVALLIRAQSLNALDMVDQLRAAADRMQEQPFDVADLRLTRYSDGGARVAGSVGNRSMNQGDTVTLIFTFYGEDGGVLGEVEEMVQLAAVERRSTFIFEFDSADQVAGYGYRIG